MFLHRNWLLNGTDRAKIENKFQSIYMAFDFSGFGFKFYGCGGSSLLQLIFASFLSNRSLKKKYLLLGINLRVAALLFLSLLLFYSVSLHNNLIILLIFLFISLFSFSGSFANVSYIDILGKSIKKNKCLQSEYWQNRQHLQ